MHFIITWLPDSLHVAERYGTNHLLDARVLLISQEKCKAPHVYGNRLDDSMFCAGNMRGGIDSCQVCNFSYMKQWSCGEKKKEKKKKRACWNFLSVPCRVTPAALWCASVMGPIMSLVWWAGVTAAGISTSPVSTPMSADSWTGLLVSYSHKDARGHSMWPTYSMYIHHWLKSWFLSVRDRSIYSRDLRCMRWKDWPSYWDWRKI